MPRVVHFELAVSDPERAAQFYREVFEWNITKWEGPQDYWLVGTGSGERGIDGGLLMRRDENQPQTVNTVDVPSVDDYVARVERSGGRVALPKMAIPGVGWLAYCIDPDGVMFGMMQPDENAK